VKRAIVAAGRGRVTPGRDIAKRGPATERSAPVLGTSRARRACAVRIRFQIRVWLQAGNDEPRSRPRERGSSNESGRGLGKRQFFLRHLSFLHL
jgi:hypothetical protein